jgi:peptidyl-prolyl cis-trans isomerase B (cyclophilin B)
VPPSGPTANTGTVAVAVETSAGSVPLTLDRSTGPCAVVNFVSLAGAGFFDGTPCHRLTTAGIFVLQCGDPTGQGSGGPGYTINDEPPTGLAPGSFSGTVIYPRGTLAMAKTAAPDSGGSQFFLVSADSPLPPDYTVFGTVDPPGLATLDKVVAAGSDDSNGQGDGKPKTPVTLTSVKVG